MDQKKVVKKISVWALRVILLALIIFWMMVIFGFSAEDGEESQSLSDRITIRVVKIVEPDYDSLSLNDQIKLFDKTSFFVRKTGHFSEYAILGLLICTLSITFKNIRTCRKKPLLILPVTVFAFLYALTDEYHQSFVFGRTPKVADAIIDTSGAFVACVCFVIIWHVVSIIKKHRDKERVDALIG